MTVNQRIEQLQMIEQNLQQLLLSKQQFQAQLIEFQSALDELKDAPEAWKIVGSVMVKSDPSKLITELESDKERVEKRISALHTQETRLRERAESLQQDVMEQMKDGRSDASK